METHRETAPVKDAGLTPVQEGLKRGLAGLYNVTELSRSPRIEALMQRLEQKTVGRSDP
jgi:hypothetical protein